MPKVWSSLIIIAVVNFQIIVFVFQIGMFSFKFCYISRIILIVPVKKFVPHVNSVHNLTFMTITLKQYEGGVSGEIDGIGGVAIVTTAVLDSSVSIIKPIWQRSGFIVFVIIIFIVPLDVSRAKTWVVQYITLGKSLFKVTCIIMTY